MLAGTVNVSAADAECQLGANEAVGVRSGKSFDLLRITPAKEAQVLLLSGQDSQEPVAVYGPFIMNTREELAQAFERYRAGKMGRLSNPTQTEI